jgi:polyisoprenoid-binding protein YceI
MRTQTLLLAFLLPGTWHFISCRETVKATVPTVEVTGTPAAPAPIPAAAIGFALQPKESILYWKGNPVVGGGHAGTLRAESGNLALDASGKLVGGFFVLDMNSILCTDPGNKGPEDGLVQHLKDPDFFDVPKFPKAFFTLLKAAGGANDSSFTITGQLNIKNKVNEITFPATLVKTGDHIQAKASLIINRVKWGITYQSANFISNLKDNAISDFIPITLDLHFKQMP